MDLFSITKAIHIIFVVSYFAGIFYMVRLFIYHTEALQKDEPERSILHRQFSFMEERLWNIITVPALIIMSVTGMYMFYRRAWAYFSWRIMKRLQAGQATLSSLQLRMLNEVATLILFVVVFAVVLKALFTTYWYFALLAFVAMGALIMLIVKLVNRK